MLTNEYLLNLFNKKPSNFAEWNEDTETIQVGLGVFSEIIRENVRAGVLLALNDAFGKK